MDHLASVYGRESTALGFMTFAAGIALTTGLSLGVLPENAPNTFAAYVAVTLSSTTMAVYFLFTYIREVSVRNKTLAKMKLGGHDKTEEN